MPDNIPYATKIIFYLDNLGALKPRNLANQHGSTFVGDGERALIDLAHVIKHVYKNP